MAARAKKNYLDVVSVVVARFFEEYSHLDVVSLGAADWVQAIKILTWILNQFNLTY